MWEKLGTVSWKQQTQTRGGNRCWTCCPTWERRGRACCCLAAPLPCRVSGDGLSPGWLLPLGLGHRMPLNPGLQAQLPLSHLQTCWAEGCISSPCSLSAWVMLPLSCPLPRTWCPLWCCSQWISYLLTCQPVLLAWVVKGICCSTQKLQRRQRGTLGSAVDVRVGPTCAMLTSVLLCSVLFCSIPSPGADRNPAWWKGCRDEGLCSGFVSVQEHQLP